MASAPGASPRTSDAPASPPMIGSSAAMHRLRQRIASAAVFDEPVLVVGESGTGKELVSRALHAASPRAGNACQVVNCAGLGADVLASELFGHRRGGFTGATQDRRGRIRAANGSTLVLDEISEAGAGLQAGLLRVLEQGEVQPVGDDGVVRVDVRFVATSNRPLDELLDGGFRNDLLHRLAALVIEVPALRERDDDIDELGDHFLADLEGRYERGLAWSDEARTALRDHAFPGNVRELRQVVLRAYASADPPMIAAEDIETSLLLPGGAVEAEVEVEEGRTALAEVIRRHIRRVIARAGGNLSQAARQLEIPRSTLQHYLVKYSIETPSRPDRDRQAAR